MAYPYIMIGGVLSIVIDNTPHMVSQNHPLYDRIIDALKKREWGMIAEYVSPKKFVQRYSDGELDIRDGKVYWRNHELHNSLTSRMVEMLRDGFDIGPMVAFLTRLMYNPSYRAINELYTFLEVCNLPITPDGYLLAFKKVTSDYYDFHSKTVLNKPAPLLTTEEREKLISGNGIQCGKHNEVTVSLPYGDTYVSMPRNMVDDDKDVGCSVGLHFCSLNYLHEHTAYYGDSARTIIVRIDPSDVVSIPVECSMTKGRACAYTIVGELNGDAATAFHSPVHDKCTIAGVDPLSVRNCAQPTPTVDTTVWKNSLWPTTDPAVNATNNVWTNPLWPTVEETEVEPTDIAPIDESRKWAIQGNKYVLKETAIPGDEMLWPLPRTDRT
jgi:hypothetical protein